MLTKLDGRFLYFRDLVVQPRGSGLNEHNNKEGNKRADIRNKHRGVKKVRYKERYYRYIGVNRLFYLTSVTITNSFCF